MLTYSIFSILDYNLSMRLLADMTLMSQTD